MTRIICSEGDAGALRSGEKVETAADPLRAALAQPSAVLLMKPVTPAHADQSDNVLVLTVRHREARQAEELADGRKVKEYTATGLLGLIDEPVYEEEPAKRRWRRK